MSLTWTQYFFWFAAPIMQMVVAISMKRRGLNREYPAFWNYTVFQVVSGIAMFVVFRTQRHLYEYLYWTVSVLGISLAFLVLREIFFDAFKPYEALSEFGHILFRWALLLLTIVATVTVLSSNAQGTERLYVMLLSGERSVRIMQCGLVAFLALFSAHLGVTRRHFLFGIALGYGVFASVQMLSLTALTSGIISTGAYGMISGGIYTVAAGIWMYYSLAPAAAKRPVEILPQSQKWNQALATAIGVPEPEGFLPNMERTVERLLNERTGKYKNLSVH